MEVLIITRSVVLQQGLVALLESLPLITFIKAITEVSGSIAWIEMHQPRIVLLDMALSRDDTQGALEKIKMLSPQTQRILLIDQVEDIRWVLQYAEAILIKGAPPSSVATIVMSLLSTKGNEYEDHEASK